MKFKYIFSIGFVPLSLSAMEKPIQKIIPSTLKTLAIAGSFKAFYSPNGRYLIIEAHNGVGNTMAVRNTQNYEEGRNIPLPPACSVATISPDNHAITADSVNPLEKWDIHTGKHEMLSELTHGASRVKYDKMGQRLIFSRFGHGDVFLLDLKSNQIIKRLTNTFTCAPSLAWNPIEDNQVGIAINESSWRNSKWCLWDLNADKIHILATVEPKMTSNVQFSSDGNSLVCGACEQFVHCDIKTKTLTYYALNGQKSDQPFKLPGDYSLYSASVVPGMGAKLFAGTSDNVIAYCDMDEPSQSFLFNPEPSNQNNEIRAIAIHPEGRQMAVGTVNNRMESVVKILEINSHPKL